jgi:hypothetical protein
MQKLGSSYYYKYIEEDFYYHLIAIVSDKMSYKWMIHKRQMDDILMDDRQIIKSHCEQYMLR